LSVEDMAQALTGPALAVDAGPPNAKAPAPGAWSEGQPSVVYARLDCGGTPGNRGKTRCDHPQSQGMF